MEIFLDLETRDLLQKPQDCGLTREDQIYHHLRFGCAATYSRARGWELWFPSDMDELFAYVSQPAARLVGFNIDGFDLPILWRTAGKLDAFLAKRPRSLDLFGIIRDGTGRWYGLDELAKANLPHAKIGHGKEAVKWLNSGDPEQVARAAFYCRDDVQIVIDLCLMLRQNYPLFLPARPHKRDEDMDLFMWHELVPSSGWKFEPAYFDHENADPYDPQRSFVRP